MQAVAVRIMQGSVLGCSTWFLIRHALTYADLRDRTAPDMSALPKTTLTATEYLAIERAAETKSEFFDGEIYERVRFPQPAEPASDASRVEPR